MYVGLNLTYASSFQMFRGSVIIFVALLSVGFLERQLGKREWTGIFAVIIGLTIVGLADFMTNNNHSQSRNNVITGDLLIITAQVITAIQMVYEERFVAGMDIPALQAVGYEGLFGFTTLGLLLAPMYFIKVGAPFNNNAHGTLEDLPDALVQIGNNWQLVMAITGTIVSIAFFNFAGISGKCECISFSSLQIYLLFVHSNQGNFGHITYGTGFGANAGHLDCFAAADLARIPMAASGRLCCPSVRHVLV